MVGLGKGKGVKGQKVGMGEGGGRGIGSSVIKTVLERFRSTVLSLKHRLLHAIRKK